jgi:hypothetical protein
LMAACNTLAAPVTAIPSITPTLTQVPALTPTETVVWFPPTPTFTPFPTRMVTPTVDLRPGIGDLLLEDNFNDPDAWELERNEQGSIALGKNELTIAIGKQKVYLSTLRRRTDLSNFYLEITASPSMCRGQDEYGLLLRATGKNNFYRFSVSCDGQARLDRLSGAEASSPQPWVLSGAIPPGAPSVSQLAVWAQGSEMRFFVNDEYLFTVRDPLFPSGTLGVFVRSTGEQAVTVNFSKLVVKKINP